MRDTLPTPRALGKLLGILLVTWVAAIRPAAAQVSYTYQGNPFTYFSCGSSIAFYNSCPYTNQYSSYTASNSVTATISLTSRLPSNLSIADIRSLPGFRLTMSDGFQTQTYAAG